MHININRKETIIEDEVLMSQRMSGRTMPAGVTPIHSHRYNEQRVPERHQTYDEDLQKKILIKKQNRNSKHLRDLSFTPLQGQINIENNDVNILEFPEIKTSKMEDLQRIPI